MEYLYLKKEPYIQFCTTEKKRNLLNHIGKLKMDEEENTTK